MNITKQIIHHHILKQSYTWVAIAAYVLTLQGLLFVTTPQNNNLFTNPKMLTIFLTGSLVAGLLTWLRQTNRQKENYYLKTFIPNINDPEELEAKINELKQIDDPQKSLPFLSLTTGIYSVIGFNLIASNTAQNLNLIVAITILFSITILSTIIITKTLKNTPPKNPTEH